ncbi:coxsackievirus and adenovirus receptor homolog isoform X1 [Erpetoichthys calabaricus]|uniref:V-set and immunoglobulin domain containing 8b n=2 Tax=Erpetoichthys calabaricus TaxID=27687 RepID=A0A8C4SA19_ERPCA|nr:coxsackievirus and adenovirus receptor homolog isoform X1 [Erpetoichthys calabaricus]
MTRRGFATNTVLKGLPVICLWIGVSIAVTVTSTGPQTVQVVRGANAYMECTYTLAATDTGDLDIEWSIVNPNPTKPDTMILSYNGGQIFRFGNPERLARFSFANSDPSKGNASVQIVDVHTSDSGTYDCKVKKTPGLDARKVTVLVLVPPTIPNCWVEGNQEQGTTVILHCKSSEGSPPLTYSWQMQTGGPLPSTAILDPNGGTLLIKNLSSSFVGSYVCMAQNSLGKQQCVLELHDFKPGSRAGMIAGAVIGSILLLLLLLLLIWLLLCCCHKKRYEKEVANEIREDAAAPVSQNNTPRGSIRSSIQSILGYRSHALINYNKVQKNDSFNTENRSGISQNGSRRSQLPPVYNQLRVTDNSNNTDISRDLSKRSQQVPEYSLSRMGAVPVMTFAHNREGYAV